MYHSQKHKSSFKIVSRRRAALLVLFINFFLIPFVLHLLHLRSSTNVTWGSLARVCVIVVMPGMSFISSAQVFCACGCLALDVNYLFSVSIVHFYLNHFRKHNPQTPELSNFVPCHPVILPPSPFHLRLHTPFRYGHTPLIPNAFQLLSNPMPPRTPPTTCFFTAAKRRARGRKYGTVERWP